VAIFIWWWKRKHCYFLLKTTIATSKFIFFYFLLPCLLHCYSQAHTMHDTYSSPYFF
jgi:hypothetical protein